MFIMLKIFHFVLMEEWCDECVGCIRHQPPLISVNREGNYWIVFYFFTFFVVNTVALYECDCQCPIFDIQLWTTECNLASFADAHAVHGLSMAYAVQTQANVSSSDDIDLTAKNLVIQSRAANYWLSDFSFAEIMAADSQMQAIGMRLFRKLYPEFHQRLSAHGAYTTRLQEIQNGCGIGLFEERYNRYWDLPVDHRLHPQQGLTHLTF